jgi:hypothetical protein
MVSLYLLRMKETDPINNRKTNKIKFVLVSEFIFGAHPEPSYTKSN